MNDITMNDLMGLLPYAPIIAVVITVLVVMIAITVKRSHMVTGTITVVGLKYWSVYLNWADGRCHRQWVASRQVLSSYLLLITLLSSIWWLFLSVHWPVVRYLMPICRI